RRCGECSAVVAEGGETVRGATREAMSPAKTAALAMFSSSLLPPPSRGGKPRNGLAAIERADGYAAAPGASPAARADRREHALRAPRPDRGGGLRVLGAVPARAQLPPARPPPGPHLAVRGLGAAAAGRPRPGVRRPPA